MDHSNNYLNAIDFFTRNKHSDYPEVVFSSVLSNLLDPKLDYVFSDELIKYFYKNYLPNTQFEIGKLNSEYSLGTAGNIDILYETDYSILGIEVKIWDRSAKNVDREGTAQLIRYANELSTFNKNWALIFIVPNKSSPICQKEFNIALKHFPDNLIMLPWNNETETEPDDNKNEESVLSILNELQSEKKNDQISNWIYDSLIQSIPNLIEQIPDPKKFPTKADLEKTNIWSLYEEFFKYYNVHPNPLHTTIGIPITTEIKKTKIHGNCLFRIRTTKDYYYKEEEKLSNLPKDFLELELWVDLASIVNDDLEILKSDYSLEMSEDFHLDRNKRIKIILLRLKDGIDVMGFVEDLDTVLRKAVKLFETKIY
ncbi:MAG: PD-(D/E)XK nuclease family protein [Ignavibacteriae bacterium]|nr:PD-(D/E)XK nuclease family protein [Ignavibacteriota bacterium]